MNSDVRPRQRCAFVATFSDGVVVSTPTAWNSGHPSVERAKFFAELAYKRQTDKSAPAIAKAQFEVGRKPRTVLRVCSAVELDAGQVSTSAPEPEPVRRRRGRPRGLKNKRKMIDDTSTSVATAPVMRRASQHEKPLLALIETSIANGTPAVSLVATSVLPANEDTPLAKAIAMVKAAGYRIERPKASKIPRPKKRVGPTFVATFATGETTRMSICTPIERLDWGRGLRLAEAAYESRWRTRVRVQGLPPLSVLPPIISAHFEQDGVVLARRPDDGAVS